MPCGAKTGLFSFFFTEQHSLINNSIKLPSIFLKGTEKIISSLSFRSYYNDIANIIRGLDPNKTHIPDMISTRMLKICGESISKSLEVMFKSRFSFLINGEKEMRFQFIKKEISWCQETSVPFHYFQYMGKY